MDRIGTNLYHMRRDARSGDSLVLTIHRGVPVLTEPWPRRIAAAEKIITEAPHIQTEQDLLEGYDYLAGTLRAAIASAWAFERDFPYFIRSATPYTKVGLDNPDTLYFSARIRDDAEYVVTGRRGTTADLSFQILNGDYSPADVPGQPERLRRPRHRDRRRTARSNCASARRAPDAGRNYFTLGPKASMLLVREVFSDWTTERRRDPHPARGPDRRRAAAAGPRAARAALPGRRQDAGAAAEDVPGVPGVVLPEAAGQHDDRAAADARRPGHAVLLGRSLRTRRRPGARSSPCRSRTRRTRASSSARCGTCRWTSSTTRRASPRRRPSTTRTG